MSHPYWPLFDLRIRTPSLELRLPDDDDLIALARLAAGGIHDPAEMPFGVPWTDAPSPQLERGVLQYGWRARADMKPESWGLGFAVLERGVMVGIQHVGADDFAIRRVVGSGSWLGRPYQGRGIGREMRAAVLHFAFAGLGAELAQSGAYVDNPASTAVSRALGYVDDGWEYWARRGEQTLAYRYRLDRSTWEQTRRSDIVIENLGPCLELLGVAGS